MAAGRPEMAVGIDASRPASWMVLSIVVYSAERRSVRISLW